MCLPIERSSNLTTTDRSNNNPQIRRQRRKKHHPAAAFAFSIKKISNTARNCNAGKSRHEASDEAADEDRSSMRRGGDWDAENAE